LNGKGPSWMVVGIGKPSACLMPSAAGDPCNKVAKVKTEPPSTLWQGRRRSQRNSCSSRFNHVSFTEVSRELHRADAWSKDMPCAGRGVCHFPSQPRRVSSRAPGSFAIKASRSGRVWFAMWNEEGRRISRYDHLNKQHASLFDDRPSSFSFTGQREAQRSSWVSLRCRFHEKSGADDPRRPEQ